MQEEVEQRTVTLIVNTAKLTERELQKAISKLLIQMKAERQHKSPKVKRGKMTVKQLAAQNRGMKSVEIPDDSVGSFKRIARKYGMSVDELAVLDGGKCILQLRGVRPFLSDKYDITKHPNYKLTADFDERNTFDVQEYLQHRLKLKGDEVCSVYQVDMIDEDVEQQSI